MGMAVILWPQHTLTCFSFPGSLDNPWPSPPWGRRPRLLPSPPSPALREPLQVPPSPPGSSDVHLFRPGCLCSLKAEQQVPLDRSAAVEGDLAGNCAGTDPAPCSMSWGSPGTSIIGLLKGSSYVWHSPALRSPCSQGCARACDSGPGLPLMWEHHSWV